MNNYINKTCSIFSVLLFSATPVLAVDDCTVARVAKYSEEPIYNVNRSLYNHQNQLALETNAILFRRGKDEAVYNEIAKNVTYKNAGKTMHIEMRQSCGWSDGAPITAYGMIEGIKQTFSEGPESSNVGRKFIKNGIDIIEGNATIEDLGLRVIDNYTFEIDITANGKLMETMLARVNFSPYPIHLSKSAQDKWDEGYLERLSSGPHYVTSINDKELKLSKNPHFCKDIQPEIENIIYYNKDKSGSQTGLFVNQIINLAEGLNTVELRALEARDELGHFNIHEISGEAITMLLQSSNGILMENPELRKAIFLATDLDRFTSILDLDKNFLSHKGALSYPYPGYDVPQDPLFDNDYENRLAQARKIMEAHNYDRDNPLTIKIVAVRWLEFEQVQTALRSMWQQIGVNIDFDFVEAKNFSWKGLEEWPGGYDYFLVGTRPDYPDASDMLAWQSLHTAYANGKELEERILKTFQMVDNEARLNELKEIELELRDSHTILTLFASSTPWVIDEALEFGKYFNPTGINFTSKTCPSKKSELAKLS